MVKTTLATSGNNAITANTTEYFRHGGHMQKSSVENDMETRWRTAGTLSNFYIRLNANSVNATSTIRTRKNNSNGGQTVSPGANATGEFTDTSGTDSVSAGDDTCVQSVPGAVSGTYQLCVQGIQFAATTDTIQKFAINYPIVTTASTTWYANISGHAANTLVTTDNQNVRLDCPIGGTLKNAGTNVLSARSSTTTIRSRKNGSNGNLVLSCTTSTTGWFEDTSNSDTIAAGDDIGLSLTTGSGAENFTTGGIFTEFLTTTSDGVCVSSTGDAVTFTDNTVRFLALSGRIQNLATENDTKQDAGAAYSYSKLRCHISANTVNTTSTVQLRKNGADATNVASITSNGTGVFADTTNTDTVTSTDEMNYEITAPSVAGTQTFTLNWIAIMTHLANNVTRALATETVTSGETLARLDAKTRTGGTQTVTIGETAARLAAKTRAIATQTTTIAENVAKVRSRNKAPAAETVTIGGGTLARLANKIRTGGTQTITVGETLTRIKGSMRSLATQTVTVGGGTLARMCAKIRVLSTSTYSLFMTGDDLEHIDLGGQTNLWMQTLDKFSFSCWVKPQNQNNFETGIFLVNDNPQSGEGFIGLTVDNIQSGSGEAKLYAGNIEEGDIMISDSVPTNDWVHLSGTFDESLLSNHLKLYINGVLEDQGPFASPIEIPTVAAYLMGYPNNASGATRGNVKDFRWWTEQTLTEEEIELVYNNDPTAPEPDYWLKMDEGTGDELIDFMGGPQDGIIQDPDHQWQLDSPFSWSLGVEISETLARLAAKTRALATQTVTIADDVQRVVQNNANNVHRIIEETVTVGGGTLARMCAKIRTGGTQTVSSGETLARMAAKTRALATQTVTIGETLTRIKGSMRSLATETITIAGGTLARMCAKIRNPIENTTVGETLARMAAKSRSIATETVTIGSGTLTRIKGSMRSLATQTVTVGDSIARMCAKIRNPIENTSIGETLTRIAAKSRSLVTETVTVGGGTVARLKGSMRSLATQTTTISDSVARMVAKTRALAVQTVTVGETLARMCAKIRTLATEIVTIADNVTGIKNNGANNIQRIIEETVTIGDSVARMAAKTRNLVTETTSIGETVVRLAAKTRAIATQTVTVTGGTVARLCSKIRNPVESVTIGETLARLANKTRTISENTTINETLTRARGINKLITETVIIAGGTVARLCAKTRNPIESVISGEVLARMTNKFRSVLESIDIQDAVNVFTPQNVEIHRIIEEIVTVGDNLDKFVELVGARFARGGAGGIRLKRLKRRNFRFGN